MSRQQVEAFLRGHDVPRGTLDLLDRFVEMLMSENERQNLIGASTLDQIWSRHILDSLQLLPLAPERAGTWIDIGSGAGMPGLVIAAAGRHSVTLVEPRRRRSDFLSDAASALGLDNLAVVQARVETLSLKADVISARAVADLPRLFEIGRSLSQSSTRWLLPKGRNARAELDAARPSWQGDFRVVPSLTDPEASIIVAEHVEPRTRT